MTKLAAAPITWGVCELPGWGQELPYRQVLDEMAALGFRGTELGPAGYLPSTATELRRELHAHGLALVGAFCPVTLHEPAAAEQSLRQGERLAQLLGALGCPWLIAADAGSDERRAVAGRVPPALLLPAEAWQRIGDGLDALARRCARYGVGVVFHPHAGTHVETEAEVEALLACAPPSTVGLCLDTGHLAYGGADAAALCRRYAGRVRHVHLKDVRGDLLARVRTEGLDYATAVGEGIFAPLGEGVVDFAAILHTLRAAGYDGWYVLEQDVRLGAPWPEQQPMENARRSLAFLRRLLES